MDEDAKQSIIDAEHLKLLRWGYFFSGAMTAFFSLFGLAYAAMGFMFVNFPVADGQNPPPEWFGLVFGILGTVTAVLMWALAAAKFRVAKALRERTMRTFCIVVAVFTMLGVPFGTLLGLLTLLVLGRSSVERSFDAGSGVALAPPEQPTL